MHSFIKSSTHIYGRSCCLWSPYATNTKPPQHSLLPPQVSFFLFNVWNHGLLWEFKGTSTHSLSKPHLFVNLEFPPEVFLKYPDLDLFNLFSDWSCVPYGFFSALVQPESLWVRRGCCCHALSNDVSTSTLSPLSPSPTTSGHFVYCSPPPTAPPWPSKGCSCDDAPDLMPWREGPLCTTPAYQISRSLLRSIVQALHVILCLVTFIKWTI